MGVCRALRYLHQQDPPILHGDLKPPNVLFQDGSFEPKLCDFGLARLLRGDVRTLGSTARWAAPEMVCKRGAKKPCAAADVFSFGRLAYFVITGLMPLEQLKADAIKEKLRKWTLPDEIWPEEPIAFQSECQQLCASCLQQDPADRPSIQDVQAQIWNWRIKSDSTADFEVTSTTKDTEKEAVKEWLINSNSLPPDACPVQSIPWHEALYKIRANLAAPKKPTNSGKSDNRLLSPTSIAGRSSYHSESRPENVSLPMTSVNSYRCGGSVSAGELADTSWLVSTDIPTRMNSAPERSFAQSEIMNSKIQSIPNEAPMKREEMTTSGPVMVGL